MERERLLATLIVLLGGVALQVLAAWPSARMNPSAARLERSSWLRLWVPISAMLIVTAWLAGWALSQPDPVPHRVGLLVFVAAAPFAIIALRAGCRALWALSRATGSFGIATVGLFRPHVVCDRRFLDSLDPAEVAAAVAHEQAHVRHRDPLRIWVGQFITDLQWPWPRAAQRFEAWLAALECARDEEARAGGIEGDDLAAAVLASIRFQTDTRSSPYAALIGHRMTLEDRVARLLRPLEAAPGRDVSARRIAWGLCIALCSALFLGLVFGEKLIAPLLSLGA